MFNFVFLRMLHMEKSSLVEDVFLQVNSELEFSIHPMCVYLYSFILCKYALLTKIVGAFVYSTKW